MRKSGFGGLVVLWLALGWSQAGAVDGNAVMSGAELKKEIVGNTLAGHYANGVVWREYFDPSGEIKGFDETDGSYVAHYSITENVLCFDYLDHFDWCGALAADGSRITFYKNDEIVKDPPYTQLLRGNPYGL